MNAIPLLTALTLSTLTHGLADPTCAPVHDASPTVDHIAPSARVRVAAAPDEARAMRDAAPRTESASRTIVGAPCFREAYDDGDAAPTPHPARPLTAQVEAKRRILQARQTRLRRRWAVEQKPDALAVTSSPARASDDADPRGAVTLAARRAAKTGTATAIAMVAAGVLTGGAAPIAAVLMASVATEALIEEDVEAADRERIVQGAALIHVIIGVTSVAATGATILGTGALVSRTPENAGLIAGVGMASGLAILATAPLASGLSTGALTFLFALDDDLHEEDSIDHVWVDGETTARRSLPMPLH